MLETGAPVLQDAVVSFDCRVAQFAEVGTHTVFFCEVEAIAFGSVRRGPDLFRPLLPPHRPPHLSTRSRIPPPARRQTTADPFHAGRALL